jgi:glycosyltransferase involved in cell wall biosynthesis
MIIATSAKPKNAEQEILEGKRPRIEYIELSRRLNAPYVDYDQVGKKYSSVLRRLEEKTKIDFYWAILLAHKIKKERIDVVLSMSERIGIPLAHMIGNRCRHGVILHNPLSPRKLEAIKVLNTAKYWHRLMPLSRAESEAIKENLGITDSQVKTVHYAIDTEFYHPMKDYDDGGYILSLGLSNRDYPTLIQAMRKLPHIRLKISGTSAWVKHRAGYESEDLPTNVEIVDYNHPSTIREAYAGSRFVVIPLNPETTQWSAGSASVLQPHAMGKPVVATHIPGLSDYIVDGETGILVKGRDAKAMEDAIDHLWNNPTSVSRMGECAIERARRLFSFDYWMASVCNLLGIEPGGQTAF